MNKEKLKQDLKDLGWSQVKLSKKLGVSTVTVNNWALGKVDVPGYVAEYLRVMKLAKQIYEGEE